MSDQSWMLTHFFLWWMTKKKKTRFPGIRVSLSQKYVLWNPQSEETGRVIKIFPPQSFTIITYLSSCKYDFIHMHNGLLQVTISILFDKRPVGSDAWNDLGPYASAERKGKQEEVWNSSVFLFHLPLQPVFQFPVMFFCRFRCACNMIYRLLPLVSMRGRAGSAQHEHHYQISSSLSDITCSKLFVPSAPPVEEECEPSERKTQKKGYNQLKSCMQRLH